MIGGEVPVLLRGPLRLRIQKLQAYQLGADKQSDAGSSSRRCGQRQDQCKEQPA